jgi:hypothetical protein
MFTDEMKSRQVPGKKVLLPFISPHEPLLPNVTPNVVVFCFVFRRSRAQISARRPAILSEDLCSFPLSLRANVGIVP